MVSHGTWTLQQCPGWKSCICLTLVSAPRHPYTDFLAIIHHLTSSLAPFTIAMTIRGHCWTVYLNLVHNNLLAQMTYMAAIFCEDGLNSSVPHVNCCAVQLVQPWTLFHGCRKHVRCMWAGKWCTDHDGSSRACYLGALSRADKIRILCFHRTLCESCIFFVFRDISLYC